MGNSPFFSVLVPTYNQAQYLGDALNSLLSQTDTDWEAVVINDGSTDNTREVIDTYCRKDKRFQAIHKENGGVASALNAGLRQARGKWICWLSSDDLFCRQKLAIHRKWIATYPTCLFFFTHFRYLNEATGQYSNPWLRTIRNREWQVLEMLRLNYVHGNSICVHKDAWAQAGTFNEELRYGQDYDMWLRLLALYPATFIPERTCITRHHSLQETRSFPKATGFDSAKAAVNFINKHSFAELVPLVDLNDFRMARKALVKTIDLAADASGMLYRLGPHPALLFRIMEWAWGDAPAEIAGTIRQIIQRRAREVSCQYPGTAFGLFWKAAAVASLVQQGRFEYQPISPAMVAEMNYWLLKSKGSTEADQLYRYLEKCENRLLPKYTMVTQGKGKEVVIVCQESMDLTDFGEDMTFRATREMAKYFMRAGCIVLLTGLSRQGVGFTGGVLFIGANNSTSWARAIKLLGPIDTLVGISRPDISRMACARRYVELPGEANGAEGKEWDREGTSWEQSGAAFLDAMDSISVGTCRIRFVVCSVFRRGQIKGTMRRVHAWIVRRRIVIVVTIIWHRLRCEPWYQWPGLFKVLWVERQQRSKAE